LDDLRKAGKKAIFIDPVRTDACKTLNGEWIAPRPQTDAAMMIGIAHTLLAENLHDTKFLAGYTRGFDRFSDYLLGKSDGVAKTAEWAEEICGIPAATLRDLAHRFASNRTLLVGGWAMQRQQHGEQPPWMLITLACMLGQIGLPGGGFVQRYHLDSGGAPPSPAPALGGGMALGERPKDGKPWPAERGAAVIPCARVVDMLLNPGKEYEFNGRTFRYPDVRMTYWVGGNPFHHHQDRNRMVAAWKKLDTFIVQDFQWTASARMADIVLGRICASSVCTAAARASAASARNSAASRSAWATRSGATMRSSSQVTASRKAAVPALPSGGGIAGCTSARSRVSGASQRCQGETRAS
jgi:trimethylamine-N-oxide reductase (cytochrome c)